MIQSIQKEHIDIFFIYGFAVCLVVLMPLISTTLVEKVSTPLVQEIEIKKPISGSIFNKNVFSNVVVEGGAYIVYDIIGNEVIASKNQDAILPLASLTKIMTAVSSTLHKDKTEKVAISQKSIEDGYDLGLKKNQVWQLGELLKYTLVFSSNDGARAVADSFGTRNSFVAQMNNDAKSLGLGFVFTDPAGLDIGSSVGGLGNVLDVAKLFAIARNSIPELLDATTKKRATMRSLNEKIVGIPNTNQSIEELFGAEGSKTGFTDIAGGNLGVIVDITVGHPVVLVVLGSSREGRFKDIATLYTALQKSLEK